MLPLTESASSQDATNKTAGANPVVKTMVASRVNPGPPVLDGKLDDPCWRDARVYSDFVQEDPVEGAEPTEKTEVRVVYSNKALYIGVRALDSEPDKIAGQLRRKDEVQGLMSDDLIMVTIDSYHDHQNGYSFYVNPRGAKIDHSWYRDTNIDLNWDGIWEVATSIDTVGWNAEFCIPFSSIRFSNAKNLVWGINVSRSIVRKKEGSEWQFRPKAGTGSISRLGHLELTGIRSHPQLELYPFLVGQSKFEPRDPLTNPDGRDLSSSVGLDVRYNIRPDIVLNAAVNPDFGQVEADPAILNLTAFETFYPEKRPFFIEGTGIFATPIQLFYTRRIGRRPATFQLSAIDLVLDYPEFTTILFAGKISGKTSTGTGVGFIEAVTDDEYASVDSMGTRKERLVEPSSNYSVARMSQDIWQGSSTVGMLLTAVNRRSAESAYSGGVDWNLRFKGNAYCFGGQLAGSSVGVTHGRDRGYGAKVNFGKEAGKYFRATIGFDALSPEFNINDLGYLSRNDLVRVSPSIRLQRLEEPWWVIRSVTNDISNELAWNYAGDNLSKNVQLSGTLTFLNYYSVFAGELHSFPSFDDRSTRGGPLLRTPSATSAWCGLTTDTRKKVYGSSSLYFTWSKSGSWTHGHSLSLYFKPSSSLALSFAGNYTSSFRDAQWFMNMDIDADGRYDHVVFGELKDRYFDLTARADMAFTPNLSFQLYMQPYIAVGDYVRFKELSRPASYEFKPFDLGFEPDYNLKALRSNVVLRWEYRPGSTLFLVWSQDRSDLSNPGDFSLRRDLKSLFAAPGRHIFLIKASYRFNF